MLSMKQFIVVFLFLGMAFFSGCHTRIQHRTSSIEEKKPSISNENKAKVDNDNLPTLNIYLENSASMDGYVKGITAFENDVYRFVDNITSPDLCKSHKLFYINSRAIPQSSDITSFIRTLEPSTFKGGSRGNTDIPKIIGEILNNNQKDVVSVFISDCIVSPGGNYQDSISAKVILERQQIEMDKVVSHALVNNNAYSFVIYQLYSNFSGLYYNRIDDITKLNNEKRPYYIWVIGDISYVKLLLEKTQVTQLLDNVSNVFSISNDIHNIEYEVVKGGGRYKLSRKNPKHGVENINKSPRTNYFTLKVNADFSSFLLDDDYLQDISNYKINESSYSLSIGRSLNDRFTQAISLKAANIKPTTLSISLLKKLPNWVENSNDDDGLDIMSNNSMRETYGIKYLLGGINDAYSKINNKYTELQIFINQ
jgi:hypothetical protein